MIAQHAQGIHARPARLWLPHRLSRRRGRQSGDRRGRPEVPRLSLDAARPGSSRSSTTAKHCGRPPASVPPRKKNTKKKAEPRPRLQTRSRGLPTIDPFMTHRSWGATLSVTIFWMSRSRRWRCSSCRSPGRMVGAVGVCALDARHRPDAGVPPLLRAPRLQDGPAHAVLLGALGTAAMQKGPLWWAGHHVTHHKYADRDGDPHSPHVSGFYYAHIGWFASDHQVQQDRTRPIRSCATSSKFWELRVMDEHYWFPPRRLGRSRCTRSAACSGWRGASCCRP